MVEEHRCKGADIENVSTDKHTDQKHLKHSNIYFVRMGSVHCVQKTGLHQSSEKEIKTGSRCTEGQRVLYVKANTVMKRDRSDATSGMTTSVATSLFQEAQSDYLHSRLENY